MTDFDPAVYGPPDVRVGTAEREQAAAALGEHFAAGRLDVAEYDDRVGRAYAARTAGELAVLFGDLPRPQPVAPQLLAPAAVPRRPVAVAPIAVAVVLVFAIAFAVATHFFPFFLFPVLFFALARGRRGWGARGYGPRYRRL
ncbi:DUF1707 SHOCT-like domain-containing protein [Nocardia yunnanensis]|uniref:DUF1707 SHOCT-like domain-containing protein n=1 Tax=Nocardia yunnanensis TaxID=2382165 RepID=UPI001CA41FDF|nr:DUF1707 domain-containing protein [Nocardia yunnanensis]